MSDPHPTAVPAKAVLDADRVLMGEAGAPADPEAARGMYEAAVGQGLGEAAERLAVLAAIGVAQPSNWGLALDRLAQALKDNPNTRVMIEGHTDSVGGDDYKLNPLNVYSELPRSRVFLGQVRLNF